MTLRFSKTCLALFAGASLSACSAQDTGEPAPATPAPAPAAGDAAGTRPAGQPRTVTYEGRLQSGTECDVLATPDGRRFAINLDDDGFDVGDYVRITGEMADASYCMEGEGTLIALSVEAAEPPARDRDPARAGGVKVTNAYVQGPWVAKGGDCAKPDFDITMNSRDMAIIETRIDGYPETGTVDVGPTPAFRFDAPIPDLPLEARGPDGLAVMPPASGTRVVLAGHAIAGDGAVFIKCARN